MTDRPPPSRPPSLGSYRPPLDRGPEPQRPDDNAMPRIVTARLRTGPPRADGPRAPRPARDRDGMSGLRILFYALFGVLAFVAAAAVAAFLLVPTDLIRDRLQAEIKIRTGRDLVIAGRSSLSLFPRPAVTVRNVSLLSPSAMGAEPLITAGEIEVAVQILPLLLHDVTIDRLVLRHPVADLRVDAQGRRSWDFAQADTPAHSPVRFAQAGPTSAKDLPKELQDFVRGSTDSSGRAGGSSRKLGVSDLTLGNVAISDGTVRYRDARSGVDETISALNVQFALANLASPLTAKADLNWHGEPLQVTANVSPVRALLEGRPVQAQITVGAAPLKFTFDGGLTPGDTLELDGRLTAAAPSLDRLSRWTGRPLAGSLPGGFSVDAKLKQSGTGIALNDARLTLGPLDGTGTLAIDMRSVRPSVQGAIRVSTLDLNVLRTMADAAPGLRNAQPTPASSPAAAPGSPKSIEDLLSAPSAKTPAAKPQVRGYTKREGWSDDVIDLTPMGLADADVKLGFDRLLWQDMTTGAGQIALALKNKVARVTLDDVQLYEGHARGIVTVDGTGADVVVGGNLVADGVSALPFLQGLAGFDWLSGRARTAIAIAGRGATERQIVGTLNGKAEISVADGALMGLNVSAIVRNLGQGKLPSFDRSPAEKTNFSAFAASTQITNGIARNTDLQITSADVRATGAGTIDLPQRTMDYMLRAKVTAAGLGIEIPLKITGSIDKPLVTPELGGAVQAVDALAKSPAGKEIQDTVNGVLKGDPAARAKVKGFLDQLLKP